MTTPERSQSIELLDTLKRVLAEWTNPAFLERMGHDAGLDLDSSAVMVLTLVGRREPVRPSSIAESMATGASNVSKILARLEAVGLVERSPDPEDARATLASTTALGKEAAVRLDDVGVQAMQSMLREWKPAQRQQFLESLRRFEEATVLMVKTPLADL